MAPELAATDVSDEILMGRAQADDSQAFAELYDRHALRAFWIARAVCHSTTRAEDVVQEGFLTIWRSRASYQPERGTFKAWSMRIVQNRAIDAFRSAASRPQEQPLGDWHEKTPVPASASPPERAIARSEAEALRASLRELPAAQAEVIVLAFFGGLSHSEIAKQLDLPTGTVKGRMRLGLSRLRGEITEPSQSGSP